MSRVTRMVPSGLSVLITFRCGADRRYSRSSPYPTTKGASCHLVLSRCTYPYRGDNGEVKDRYHPRRRMPRVLAVTADLGIPHRDVVSADDRIVDSGTQPGKPAGLMAA